METNFTPKNAKFECKFCDFKCFKQSDFNRHVKTIKHLHGKEGNKKDTEETKKTPLCICSCGKEYSSRAGLWKHKKKCNNEKTNIVNDIILNKELILTFLKQNQDILKENSDLKHIMMDTQSHMMDTQSQMLKVIENGTHHTTNNNSYNKSFNLNVFLNETCKNAMNMTAFIDSLQLQISDLEKVGELGYIEGIYSIIMKNLNALDITERPIHCTDKKRETMYIKDEDKWEKEDEKKVKLHKMVRKVANKNIDLISDFKQLYPDWKKSTSKVSDQFNKIIIESMGGPGDNEYENEEKVIKKVAKEVFIDKIHT
jgi:hypothetical protein